MLPADTVVTYAITCVARIPALVLTCADTFNGYRANPIMLSADTVPTLLCHQICAPSHTEMANPDFALMAEAMGSPPLAHALLSFTRLDLSWAPY